MMDYELAPSIEVELVVSSKKIRLEMRILPT